MSISQDPSLAKFPTNGSRIQISGLCLYFFNLQPNWDDRKTIRRIFRLVNTVALEDYYYNGVSGNDVLIVIVFLANI